MQMSKSPVRSAEVCVRFARAHMRIRQAAALGINSNWVSKVSPFCTFHPDTSSCLNQTQCFQQLQTIFGPDSPVWCSWEKSACVFFTLPRLSSLKDYKIKDYEIRKYFSLTWKLGCQSKGELYACDVLNMYMLICYWGLLFISSLFVY